MVLAGSKTRDRIWALILVNSLSWPSVYLRISPLKDERRMFYSTSMGEKMLQLTSRIF